MTWSMTVMMYHYVRDVGDAAERGLGIPGLPVADLGAQLDQLQRAYEMIGWEDVRAAVLGQRALPDHACLLTFDDGLCDHYINVYPALRRRKLSAIFFALARRDEDGLVLGHKLHCLLACLGMNGLREELLKRFDGAQRARFFDAEIRYRARWNSELDVFKGILQRDLEGAANPIFDDLIAHHIGSQQELARQFYLSAEQVREMRAGGMHFGGHSCTHPWFDFVDAARREREIYASADWLAPIEQGPFAFAYPYGGLADDAPALLAKYGFAAAFTTREQVRHDNPFYIGRIDGEEWNGGSAA